MQHSRMTRDLSLLSARIGYPRGDKSRRALLLLGTIAAVTSAGCASPRQPVQAPLDTGYRIRINQGFEQLPNFSRIYFQQGERVQWKHLDRWSTHCEIRVFNRSENASYLTRAGPGEFAISRVRLVYQSSEYPYYGSHFDGLGFVGFGFVGSLESAEAMHHDGPPSYFLYRVEMKLTSPEQPDVQSLTCMHKRSTRGNYFPSLADIRQALGSLIELWEARS